jgi:hypothetical protein
MTAFLYVALCSLLDRGSHSRRKEHAVLIFKGIGVARFYPEERGSMFIRNIGHDLLVYKASHPTKELSS